MQDLWVYVSEKSEFTSFGNDEALVWHETNIPYAVWTPDSVRHKSFTYYPSEAVQKNGTLYSHVFFARSGFSPDPASPEYVRTATFSSRHGKNFKYRSHLHHFSFHETVVMDSFRSQSFWSDALCVVVESTIKYRLPDLALNFGSLMVKKKITLDTGKIMTITYLMAMLLCT